MSQTWKEYIFLTQHLESGSFFQYVINTNAIRNLLLRHHMDKCKRNVVTALVKAFGAVLTNLIFRFICQL